MSYKSVQELNNFLSINQSDDDHNDGNDEEDMNETPERVSGHDAQEPKDDENNGNSPQHMKEIKNFIQNTLS
jgi:hypothetical protein